MLGKVLSHPWLSQTAKGSRHPQAYLLPSGHVEGAEASEMEPMTQFCCVTLSLPAQVA